MSIQDKNKWSDDPELTAYAFGELEGEERAAFEARVAGDGEAQALIEELRSLGGALEEHFAGELVVELSQEQRTAIESELEPSAAIRPKGVLLRGRFGWIGLAAASVLGVATLIHRDAAPVESGLLGYDLTGGARTVSRWPAAAASRHLGQEDDSDELVAFPGLADGGDGSGSADRVLLPAEQLAALENLGYTEPPAEEVFEEAEVELALADELNADAASPNEDYNRIIENPFQLTSDRPLSTFSIDVDTASYANTRRMLRDGYLPPVDAVRIEEFINYFHYDYGAPTDEHPFHVNVEVGSAPWAPLHRILRIGLQGKQILPAERKASNLVFLMDVSGSMDDPHKLPLLKQALHMLVQELDERDTVSIVVYAGASGLALPATHCDDSVQIHMALEALEAGGSTNGGAGIELAYSVAAQNFIAGGINRVILATDGDFNVGLQSDGSLVQMIEQKAKTGVFLSVLGFGRGNLKDSKMEQLADKGKGNYAYIDSALEARKVLVEELGSTLETIAKDVKIQVEFNPSEVQAYRLIGYENRMLAAQDFNDDSKDAGEIGAGHHVTALYEIVPVGVEFDAPKVDPLRYQTPGQATGEAFNGELCALKLRYKQPEGKDSMLFSTPIRDSGADFQELSDDTRWAITVAAFGMLLRHSAHSGTATIEDVSRWAIESAGEDPGGYRAQFIGLVSRARELMEK